VFYSRSYKKSQYNFWASVFPLSYKVPLARWLCLHPQSKL
jgi:hypothetical protein